MTTIIVIINFITFVLFAVTLTSWILMGIRSRKRAKEWEAGVALLHEQCCCKFDIVSILIDLNLITSFRLGNVLLHKRDRETYNLSEEQFRQRMKTAFKQAIHGAYLCERDTLCKKIYGRTGL